MTYNNTSGKPTSNLKEMVLYVINATKLFKSDVGNIDVKISAIRMFAISVIQRRRVN
jgi:hypothetical protein